MFTQRKSQVHLVVMLALLVTVVGAVWATPKSAQRTSECAYAIQSGPEYYEGSFVVRKGSAGSLVLVREGTDTISISVVAKALDAYMAEKGIDRVTITVSLLLEEVTLSDGSSFYRLDFVFGPSGAFFEPELQLILSGKFTQSNASLYDENGEALEGSMRTEAGRSTFFIPHFSSYSYDQYDYVRR